MTTKKVEKQIIEDLLAAHADALNGAQPGDATWPAELAEEESVRTLLALAEWLQDSMTPVQPPSSFRHGLGKQLLASTRQKRKDLTIRTRRAALVGAAAWGSLLSLVSAMGVVAYRYLTRPRVGS